MITVTSATFAKRPKVTSPKHLILAVLFEFSVSVLSRCPPKHSPKQIVEFVDTRALALNLVLEAGFLASGEFVQFSIYKI